MLNIKLHTPIGVKDVLPKEASIKKKVVNKIEKTFDRYGYELVESPIFEYIEVFSDEKMGSTNPKQMYRFFDRKGSELSLRSDMTPPIARIAATVYSDTIGSLRFAYTGNVFRDNETYQGKMCEFTQGGVELIGIKSIHADAEVLALAVKSVLAAGIKEFRIHVGQVDFFNNILEETRLLADECDELKNLVAERNYVGVEELIEDKAMSEISKNLFMELPKMVGTVDMLEKASTLTKNEKALKALKEMKELYEYLKAYDVQDYVIFDLGMVNSLNYYTGIIFRGYTYGTGYSIVDGGRYDNLVSQFGKNSPAVGFAIKIDEILAVLENVDEEETEVRGMVAYGNKGVTAAIKIADTYRKSGISLEIGLESISFEEALDYAEKRKIDSMIYLIDDVNLKYARIDESIGIVTSDMTMEDLVGSKKGGIE